MPTLVTLNCSLKHQAIPNATFAWTRNDQLINDTHMIEIKYFSENGTLLIINVTQSTDEAKYCCKAESFAARDEACLKLEFKECKFFYDCL